MIRQYLIIIPYLLKEVAPIITAMDMDEKDRYDVIKFLADTDQFFLNIMMATGKAVMDDARKDTDGTIVTAMCRNGYEFGIRIATGNGAASGTITSRGFAHWRFRDFSLWYALGFIPYSLPALRLRATCTQLCGRLRHIPLSSVSAFSRQAPSQKVC